jgi:hypothetical protein
MKLKTMLMIGAAGTAFATPSFAFETLKFGAFALDLKGELESVAMQDGVEDESTFENKLTMSLALSSKHDIGGLTFGTQIKAKAVADDSKSDVFVLKDPTWKLTLKGDRFGTLSLNDASSASGENCVQAASVGDIFDLTDHIDNTACPEYDDATVLYYQTPELAGGYQIAASYMTDAFGGLSKGDAERAISLGLTYAGAGFGGDISASLGVEHVLSVKGSTVTMTAWQAGVNLEKADWLYGAALGYTDFSNGDQSLGAQVAVTRKVSDGLDVGLGLNWSNTTEDGDTKRETSLGVVAEYVLLEDHLTADAGLWQIQTDEAGVGSNDTVFGVGLTVEF